MRRFAVHLHVGWGSHKREQNSRVFARGTAEIGRQYQCEVEVPPSEIATIYFRRIARQMARYGPGIRNLMCNIYELQSPACSIELSKNERLRNEAWRDGTTGRGTISTKILSHAHTQIPERLKRLVSRGLPKFAPLFQ
jgi:hypothetical protein